MLVRSDVTKSTRFLLVSPSITQYILPVVGDKIAKMLHLYELQLKGNEVLRKEFIFNERLGIPVPELLMEWESYSLSVREQIVDEWEQIRGRIPERIYEIEKIINFKQNQLNVEDDFPRACQLNTEIAECASTINDLHLWYRANQDLHSRVHQ